MVDLSQTIVHKLKDSVKRFPSNEAIVTKDKRVTYNDLWGNVCNVSSYLRKIGLQPGDRVAILHENSPEYIATYYGILASGCVAVGLNSDAKPKDIINWLNHCGASLLFIDDKYNDIDHVLESPEIDLPIVGVGDSMSNQHNFQSHWDDVAIGSSTEPDLSILSNPNDPAAIIYTSGTTGNPKGVTLSHRNINCNIESILEYLKLSTRESTAYS